MRPKRRSTQLKDELTSNQIPNKLLKQSQTIEEKQSNINNSKRKSQNIIEKEQIKNVNVKNDKNKNIEIQLTKTRKSSRYNKQQKTEEIENKSDKSNVTPVNIEFDSNIQETKIKKSIDKLKKECISKNFPSKIIVEATVHEKPNTNISNKSDEDNFQIGKNNDSNVKTNIKKKSQQLDNENSCGRSRKSNSLLKHEEKINSIEIIENILEDSDEIEIDAQEINNRKSRGRSKKKTLSVSNTTFEKIDYDEIETEKLDDNDKINKSTDETFSNKESERQKRVSSSENKTTNILLNKNDNKKDDIPEILEPCLVDSNKTEKPSPILSNKKSRRRSKKEYITKNNNITTPLNETEKKSCHKEISTPTDNSIDSNDFSNEQTESKTHQKSLNKSDIILSESENHANLDKDIAFEKTIPSQNNFEVENSNNLEINQNVSSIENSNIMETSISSPSKNNVHQPPIKRSRGRPKKDLTLIISTIPKENTSIDFDNCQLDVSNIIDTKRSSRKTRKIIELESSENEEDKQLKTSKRKSRKIIYDESDDFNSDNDSECIHDSTNLETRSNNKRRPGRPKKYSPSIETPQRKSRKIINDESDDLNSDNDSECIHDSTNLETRSNNKRRPGRPKKYSPSIETPKRKSRKIIDDDSDIDSKSDDNNDDDDDDDKKKKLTESNVLVTCQVCNEKMTRKKFMKTHKQFHNELCWTEYDEPIDFYNPTEVINILYIKRKRNDLKFICPNCKLLKKSELGYYSHFLLCGKNEMEIEKAYKVCKRCHQNIFIPFYHTHEIKHIKEDEAIQFEKEENEKKNNEKPIAIHLEEEEIGHEEGRGRKRSAAKKAITKISKINEKLKLPDEEEVIRKRKPKEDVEFEMSENEIEEDEEEDIDENLSAEENNENEPDEVCSDVVEEEEEGETVNVGNTFRGNEYTDKQGKRRNLVTNLMSTINQLSYVYKQMISYWSQETLFIEFSVPEFNVLDVVTAKLYLPLTNESVTFQHDKHDPIKLNLFTNHRSTDVCTLFCGGPIWALSWLPEVVTQKKTDQYLAVAAHRDMNKLHMKNVSQAYKSMIQIWRFPQMSCITKTIKEESPYLMLGIAHEEGAVWTLEWCPSGSTIPGERLGLLAAACSSGRILIHSIPVLEKLNTVLENSPIIISMEPVRIFQLEVENTTPCTHIAWKKSSPHESLIAGYGDGTVAIFDFFPKLSLLVEGNVVEPISIFQAHLGEITVLSPLITSDCRYLLTCGGDKFLKIWDLSDVTSPIESIIQNKQSQKKPISGGFIPWLPIYLTSSEGSHYNEIVTLIPNYIREFTCITGRCPRTLEVQKSAHFTLGFSNLCSSFVTGNEDGVLYIYSYTPSTFTPKKTKEEFRALINTKLVPIEDTVSDISYENASARYKLEFSALSKQIPKGKKYYNYNEDFDLANFVSSAWNNNPNNMLYVAAGQKCGLLHIINSNLFSEYRMRSFFKDVVSE